MKTLIKLFITIAFTIIFSLSAFAESGAEFILNVPIGGSFSIISESMKDVQMQNSFGFDAGVNAQFGGMFQIKEGFGLSVLADIGYSHDNYKIKYEGNYLKDYYFRYDSIQVGLLSKFNIEGFSIGIGGGIKFPIYDYWGYSYKKNNSSSYASYSVENNEDTTSGEDGQLYDSVYYGDEEQWVDYVYMYDENIVYKPYYFIPYVKLTLDYSIFLNQKWAINIGLYCRYDFLPERKRDIFYYNSATYDYGYIDKPKNYGTLNFGVQLGLRFGPRV